jgi:hypothetical protein
MPCDLAIIANFLVKFTDEVYKPAIAKRPDNTDPCTPANGELTTGYGNGGSPPQSFRLPSGLDTDVSYLKVFLTSQPIDLSQVAQILPFEQARYGRAVSSEEYLDKPRRGLWDTLLVAIVQTCEREM